MPTFERDGVSLYYEVAGDSGNPSMVLLHGFTSDHRAWRQLSEVLATSFCVIAPDLRGHGASDAPDELDSYTMEAYSDDLGGLLHHLDIERTALVGSSFGGMVALEYSVQHPETLSALVLTDTSPAYEHPRYAEAFSRREAGMSKNEDIAARMGMEALAKVAAKRVSDTFVAESLRKRYAKMSRAGFLGAAKTRRERRDVSGLLRANLTMPVLLCAGQEDPVFSALPVMADELPDARVVEFRGCGHGVPFIKPGEFSRVLGEFLGDVRAGHTIAAHRTV
jgi:pimeloyl-ACP methyl ester carboxylesterase